MLPADLHFPYFFFFLMIPPPPRSTLFPYTTLFRSHIISRWTTARGEPFDRLRAGEFASKDTSLSSRAVPTDRKSTRLNSSHRTISYAVFCLKKKKQKTIHYPNILRTPRPPP